MSMKKKVRKLIKKEKPDEEEKIIEEQSFDKRVDEILLEEVDDSDLQFDDEFDDDKGDFDIEPADEIGLDPDDLSLDVDAPAEEVEKSEETEESEEEDPFEKIRLELNDIANSISANRIKLSNSDIDKNKVNEIASDLESVAKKTQKVLGDLEEFWNQKTAAGDNLNVKSD